MEVGVAPGHQSHDGRPDEKFALFFGTFGQVGNDAPPFLFRHFEEKRMEN